jgi:hypothetical protein
VTTPTTVKVQLKLRQDTSSGWSAVNPILLAGELGRESNTGKIKIGDGSTAWNSLAYQPFGALITNADISATAEIAVSKLADGAARQLLQTDTAGTGVEWTSNVDVPGTLDVTGAATFDAAVTIAGDLTVNGTTTNINTQNLVVEDKNIILADVATPTDTTADGGGITLKGATDKTITWSDTTNAWTSNQVLDVPAGSAATPSLIFGADVNTGIYSPGADQVAISTNGTGRLFIDSSGRVGVNTATPERSLGVFSSTNDDGVQLRNTSTAASTSKNIRIQFSGTDTAGTAKGTGNIYCFPADQDFVGAHLSFWTRGSDVNSEKMRLDSSGRLGLGTSTFASGGGQGTGTSAQINGSLYVYEGNNSADHGGAIAFGINNLATYTPMAQIKGKLEFSAGTELQGGIGIFTRPVAGGASGQTLTERITVKANGNVGIGTTSPGQILTANGALQSTSNSSSFDQQGIQLDYFDSGSIGRIAAHKSTGSSIGFFTNSSGGNTTERARIDSSGRLLVGTSTSASGGQAQYARLQVEGNTFGVGQGIVAIRRASSSSGLTTGTPIGQIDFTDNAGEPYARIEATTDGSTGTGDYPSRLVFSTTADGASSPTERMRIANNGAFDHYTNTYFGVRTNRTSGTENALAVINNATSTATGNTVCLVKADGDVENTNNSYGAISDSKLKENIISAASQWDDIKALNVRKYNFKAETGYATHVQIGLIAQEVELVSPGLVSESPDRDEDGNDLGTVTKSVNYSVLYMKAVKALQEAMERIETLEAKVAALEGV